MQVQGLTPLLLPAKPIKESHAGYLDPDKSARIAGALRFHRPYTSMKTKYEDFSQNKYKTNQIIRSGVSTAIALVI